MPDSAILAYERSIRLNAAFPEAHLRRAQILFQRGDLVASEAAYSQVVRFAPDHLEGLNNLGFVRRKLGDLIGAEAAYVRLIAIDSTIAHALNNLGQVYREQERWADARSLFHRAMVVDPSFRGAYLNLARLHEATGDQDLERELLQEIRTRFGASTYEGRLASQRLQALGPADVSPAQSP
jgi:tetratricopeptide (TPR) repeat protein